MGAGGSGCVPRATASSSRVSQARRLLTSFQCPSSERLGSRCARARCWPVGSACACAEAPARSSRRARRSPVSSWAIRSRLGPPDRKGKALGPDKPLEGPDGRPQRSEPQSGSGVGRVHARLRDELAPVPVEGLNPVGEEHTNRSLLVPLPKGGLIREHRIVAAQDPDAPAEARDERVRSLLEDGEGTATKEIAEGLLGRGPGYPPAHEAAERPGVGEAYRLRCTPELVGCDEAGATVTGPHGGIRQPTFQTR